jgi:hypothetical protein
MRRRDFVKLSAALGIPGIAWEGCSSAKKTSAEARFNVHPFVLVHPEAVFVHFTQAASKEDGAEIRRAGQALAADLIVKTVNSGYPVSAPVVVKPNWTCASPKDGAPVVEKLGINTDPNFIEGWVRGMKQAGPRSFFIRECACPASWKEMGWEGMCERNGIDLRDLSTRDVWELAEGREIIFRKTRDGVVMREVAYMAPAAQDGSVLINIAKLKSHCMGITGAVKNLQGLCARRFHQFCTPHADIRAKYEAKYHGYFQPGFEGRIEELYAGHVKNGIPRWDRPGPDGGIIQEQWVQRTIDSVPLVPAALHMIEGVYSEDGNGFGIGPHEPLGPSGVTSRDFLSNVVIFGANPFRVDIVAHWIAGHEPGNFGLFHLAAERGALDVLDPRDIPLYVWKEGRAALTALDRIPRTPLSTPYLRRDYGGGNEPEYHLVNEPFDYSAWKKARRSTSLPPSIRHIGADGSGRDVFDLFLPRSARVSVEAIAPSGTVVGCLAGEEFSAGSHLVLLDRRVSPGAGAIRVRGEGWETACLMNANV